MTWLTWRQLRAQTAAVYVLVVAAVLTLAATGPRLASKAGVDANLFDHLTRVERDLYYAGVVVLAIAPAVIGAFWGAPLVARELEAGTYRLVWNQSVTRTRWLATKLAVTSLVAAAAVGALSLAVTWWSDPVDGALSRTHGSLPSRVTPVVFAMRGIVPVAYVVFALLLGVACGAVLRRSVPAMALTLGLFIAVQIAVPLWVRPHLVPPDRVTTTFSLSRMDGISMNDAGGTATITMTTGHPGAWTLSYDTVDSQGRVVALPAWVNACVAPPAPPAEGQPVAAPDGGDKLQSCFARLTAEGYHQRITYQPESHFWPLQLAETGLFLALSALLAWFSFWWVRNRLS
jgi:hypothetical protein